MDRNRGGGGLKPASLDLLEEMHDLLARKLPQVPDSDPFREQLVELEQSLRRCCQSVRLTSSASSSINCLS
jgi:hypothetical protein